MSDLPAVMVQSHNCVHCSASVEPGPPTLRDDASAVEVWYTCTKCHKKFGLEHTGGLVGAFKLAMGLGLSSKENVPAQMFYDQQTN